MKQFDGKRIDRLLTGLDIACGTMLGAAVILNFANIVGRYVFHAPIEWAEEVMLYLMIGLVFVGAAKVAFNGGHIRMDVLLRFAPRGMRLALNILSELLTVGVSLVAINFAWPTILQLKEFDQRSVAADIPIFIPQSAIPIGFLLIAGLIVLRLCSGRWSAPQPSSTH